MPASSPRSTWRDYRIRWWLALTLGGTALATAFSASRGDGLSIWFACAFVPAVIWLGLFRCPGCGKHFHRKAGWHNVLARRCLNCGLRALQEPPAPGPAAAAPRPRS